MIFSNLRGTSEPHFRISLSGPTVYHGTTDPSAVAPTSLDGGALNPGDLYVRTDGANRGLWILGNGGDLDWEQLLDTGGGLILGGSLTVNGQFDTSDPIIELNSGGGALSQGGIQINRPGSEVRWVWDDPAQYWRADTVPSTPSLHNVFVENDLTVGGLLEVDDGDQVNPSVYFVGDTNTGIYSPGGDQFGITTAGALKWQVNATGNLLAGTDNLYDIGSSTFAPKNIYTASQFLGVNASVAATPNYAFVGDVDTGIFHPANDILAISANATEMLRIDSVAQTISISNTDDLALDINGSGFATLRIATDTAGEDAVLQLEDSAGNDWSIRIDDSDADDLDFRYNNVSQLDITPTGQLKGQDGTLALPTYSFDSDTGSGMFLSGSLGFSVSASPVLNMLSTGLMTAATVGYESLVLADNDIPNRKFVLDQGGASSWRAPVIVKDDTSYANLAAAELTMNGGTVDGISINSSDRILYTAITGENANVFVINGVVGGGATLVEDTNLNTEGDALYVIDGTSSGSVYAYDVFATWTEISGSGGAGLFLQYEIQTAIAAQVVFNLASIAYAPTADGSRLIVFVNGVKQVFGGGNAYVETDSTTVTFNVAPGVGAVVEFYAVSTSTNDAVLLRETQTGLVGTPVINFGGITYVVGQDGLLVFLNGVKMLPGVNYTETTSTSITWVAPPLIASDDFEFYSSVPLVAGTDLEDIANVDNAAPTNGDVLTYVTANLRWESLPPSAGAPGTLFDELVAGGAQAIFNTVNVSTITKTGTQAFQQVFVNGILQKEGPGFAYTVTGANQITFAVVVPAAADVTIYQL